MSKDSRKLKQLRVAIVHRSLYQMRGAERTVEALGEIFPQAEIIALYGSRKELSDKLLSHPIRFSWMNKLPLIRKYHQLLTPIIPFLIESIDLRGYDLVISSSSDFAKGILVPPGRRHVAYVYTPLRYLWDLYPEYLSEAGFFKRVFTIILTTPLRVWDLYSTNRIRNLVVISQFVRRRIEQYHGVDDVTTIYPPVELDHCYPDSKKDYYLAINPSSENKGLGALRKLAQLSQLPIKVIGMRGSSSKNLQMLGWVDESEKYKLIAQANCVISLGVEDFGIAMVESIASGTPVLAYDKGGAREIVKDGVSGVLLKDLDTDTLKEGLARIGSTSWDYSKMRGTVKRFSKERFMREFAHYVQTLF